MFANLNTEEMLCGQNLSFVVVVFVKYKTACQISNQMSLQKGFQVCLYKEEIIKKERQYG